MKEKTLNQRRAADALRKIEQLRENPRRGKYDSYVDGLPATILMSGLGQATAMLLASARLGKQNRSDDNRAYKTLYDHLSSWLCRNEDDAPYQNAADLMEAITGDERGEDAYIHAQAEAMTYLEWLKKFSNAYLKD